MTGGLNIDPFEIFVPIDPKSENRIYGNQERITGFFTLNIGKDDPDKREKATFTCKRTDFVKGTRIIPLYKSLSFKNKKYSLKFYKYFKEFYYICKDKKR